MGCIETNVVGYRKILELEVLLRELIIDEGQRVFGQKWHKRMLPGDVLAKFRDARQYELRTPWVTNIPHHPIYYVDFPDLSCVIERTDNWKAVFEQTFSRKDVVLASLRAVEPVRNRIAHSRALHPEDLTILDSACQMVMEATGQERATTLISRINGFPSISESVTNLSRIVAHAEATLSACGCSPPILEIEGITNQWWFDTDYLGQPTDPVIDLVDLLREYSDLERGRGRGHLVEAWLSKRGFRETFARAREAIEGILESCGKGYHR